MSEDDGTGVLNTRFLMTASAAFMAVVGLFAAIFSRELLQHFGHPAEGFAIVLVKMVAGLYFGLAILNWMARGNIIGGIYSRPVALANFAHFLAVALVLMKQLPVTPNLAEFAVVAGANVVFAGAFGFILFGRGAACGESCG